MWYKKVFVAFIKYDLISHPILPPLWILQSCRELDVKFCSRERGWNKSYDEKKMTTRSSQQQQEATGYKHCCIDSAFCVWSQMCDSFPTNRWAITDLSWMIHRGCSIVPEKKRGTDNNVILQESHLHLIPFAVPD